MSYAAWSRKHFSRPPFFKTLWRDIRFSARRIWKEWMAWYEIDV